MAAVDTDSEQYPPDGLDCHENCQEWGTFRLEMGCKETAKVCTRAPLFFFLMGGCCIGFIPSGYGVTSFAAGYRCI